MSGPTYAAAVVRALAGAVLVLALAACGSTVQTDPTADAGPAGALGTPYAGGDPLAPGAGGVVAPDVAGPGPAPGVVTDPGGAVVPGAGTPGGPGSPTGGATTAPTGEALTTAAGTERDTTPITVGILVPKRQEGRFMGVQASGNWPGDIYLAIIKALNKAGGIGGRRIDPVVAQLDSRASSYASEIQSACSTFTEDNQVDLVLDNTLLFTGIASCLENAGIANIHGGFTSLSADELAEYPNVVLTDAPNVDRRMRGAIEAGVAAGTLRRGDTLGVIVEACGGNVDAYDDAVVPAAKAAGISLQRADIECATGFGSAASASTGVSSSVLRFRTAGVDVVSMISNLESLGALLFATSAQTQGWAPKYLLTSTATAPLLAPNVPAQQIQNWTIAGTYPTWDLTALSVGRLDRRCLDLVVQGGYTIKQGDRDSYSSLESVCGTLLLADAALKATGGSTEVGAVVAAVRGLGRFGLPASVGESNDFSRVEGVTRVQVSRYDTRCRCFAASGAPRTIG